MVVVTACCEDGGASVVRGRSSVWLEHSTVTREVAGSSPVGPVLGIDRMKGDVCWSASLLVACGVREAETRRLVDRSFQFRALVVKLVDTQS